MIANCRFCCSQWKDDITSLSNGSRLTSIRQPRISMDLSAILHDSVLATDLLFFGLGRKTDGILRFHYRLLLYEQIDLFCHSVIPVQFLKYFATTLKITRKNYTKYQNAFNSISCGWTYGKLHQLKVKLLSKVTNWTKVCQWLRGSRICRYSCIVFRRKLFICRISSSVVSGLVVTINCIILNSSSTAYHKQMSSNKAKLNKITQRWVNLEVCICNPLLVAKDILC